jgi:hypothetical protein
MTENWEPIPLEPILADARPDPDLEAEWNTKVAALPGAEIWVNGYPVPDDHDPEAGQ